MYNKIDTVFKIGTILSFFLFGINSFSFIDYDIEINKILLILPDYVISFFKFIIDKKINLKDSLFMIAFGGITWSLIYCFKFYKSKNVSISFRLVKKYHRKFIFFKKLQQKYIEYIIYNNTNHNIVISDIFLWQKRNILGEEKIMTMQIKPEITFIFGDNKAPKEKQIFIPANQEYKPQISISTLNGNMSFHNTQISISTLNGDMSFHNNQKIPCVYGLSIRYQFTDGKDYDTLYKIYIQLSKKEIKMFEKLSQK